MSRVDPSQVFDCYIALYFEPAQVEDPPLHVTLAFIESSTPMERAVAWRAYLDAASRLLPLEVFIGEIIKVGPDKQLEARECSVSSEATSELLKQLYRTHTRRVNNVYPELLIHTTMATEKKRKACDAFGETARATSIVLKSVGASKRTLYSLEQHE